MKRRTVLVGGSVLLAAAVVVGVVALAGPPQPTAAAEAPPATEAVQRGELSASISQAGTLAYRARPDGSPWTVINQAGGTYTQLPDNGDEVDCGQVLYRVDDVPVVLLCGTVPAYRDLHPGDAGQDVRQLNANLHQLGFDTGAAVDPADRSFTARTATALTKLQRARGLPPTGTLTRAEAVFLSGSVRIAKVNAVVGGAAAPGAPALSATSDQVQVLVDLDPSQQGDVAKGDRARITLPGLVSVTGRVAGFGRVAQASPAPDGTPADATIPTYISLDDPAKADGLDQAPVEVDVTTRGVQDALSVPVTALVGKAGGGFAVEVVRPGGRRELVAVTLGLFDSGGGRVQVEGELHEGDAVVVPSP